MYDIIILQHFRKQVKQFVKKYPSLKQSLISELQDFNKSTQISLGHELYKIRISPKELAKGKSKSLRLIVLCIERNNTLVPVTIYSKSSTANISQKELEMHLEIILFELSES